MLKTLIDAKRIPPPARTIRFIWPSEMTGTIAYLTSARQPAPNISAAVHLDMVGGDPFITKSVLHATRSPWSIATVTDDVQTTFARYVIDGAMRAAGDGDMSRAIRAQTGSKDAFWADVTPYESGSDHWIYQEGGFRIPAIYLRDHPDVYIHTTGDVVDNIEPTKIKRSAFIAAASGYYLSRFPDGGQALLALSYANALERLGEDARRATVRAATDRREAAILIGQAVLRERRRMGSLGAFIHADARTGEQLGNDIAETGKRLLARVMPQADADRFAAAGFQMPAVDRRCPSAIRRSEGRWRRTATGWARRPAARAQPSRSRACRTAATSPMRS